ncbi:MULTISPECIES: hypothetical protein [unclassified Marinitoga]|uniref:hypothetical protein n=1 Tax=unclassified Marinitoga TaxID=2640159 RepID=UPI000640F5B6|nr:MULTISPECIES: hypothetical protein [unclassified Marinitoga]KLO23979.1 hypothetical protein X274_05530 [Marinitoga sp. 1155]NUU99165.1 hypothetical protein [Marinitoga sp. 1154]
MKILKITMLFVALILFSLIVFADTEKEDEDDILHLEERGCSSCHKVVTRGEEVFDYTLYAEVKKIEEHPALRKETVDEQGVLYCLLCHENLGEKSFKKIIHPIHYFSEHFDGNCFSCHDISDEGEFKLFDEVWKNNKELDSSE